MPPARTEMGMGYSNPRNQAFFDQWNDDEEIVGYTPDGQEVYESPVSSTRRRPTLSDIENDNEALKASQAQVASGGKPYPVGTAQDGGTMMSDGSVVPMSVGPDDTSVAANASTAAVAGFPQMAATIAAPYVVNKSISGVQNIAKGKDLSMGEQAALALPTFGLSFAYNSLFGESKTKVEEDRRKQLKEQGIEVPNYDTKEWEQNEVFRESRNEADLKGGDIENSAHFYGINGWQKLDQAKKEAAAQKAIDLGLIREHHGTIDLSMTPEYEEYLKSQIGGGEQSTGGVDMRRVQAEQKKQRKRAALSSLMPDITSTPTTGPRYDQNPGSLIKNPYL